MVNMTSGMVRARCHSYQLNCSNCPIPEMKECYQQLLLESKLEIDLVDFTSKYIRSSQEERNKLVFKVGIPHLCVF